MIWPFLMIYVSERLSLPLTGVAGLTTINAITGLLSLFIAGPITDHVGRKWVMVVSLLINGLSYILMSQADTVLIFAVLMGLRGFFNPLYGVGSDAMLTDLILPKKRANAYALLRLGDNLGIALGPAIGGIVTSASYTAAFYVAAASLIAYGAFIAFFTRETLTHQVPPDVPAANYLKGYGQVLKDRTFLYFTAAFTLFQVCASMLWVLLAVYVKQNYQVPESQYGLILTTNAIMVVLLQVSVTRVTRCYPPLWVLAVGVLIYATGVGSVAMGQGFWGFWTSFVIVTIGELAVMPTASTFAADQAPADMRGRYMSIYALTRGVGAGIGPVFGGILNDNLGPRTTWYGGAIMGLLGAISFAWLAHRSPPSKLE